MDTTKSPRTSQSEDAVQASVHSTRIMSRRRIQAQIVENVLLTDCFHIANQLQQVVNDISTFIDPDQCVDFITDYYSEHICLIIHHSLCKKILPLIHDIVQLGTIFILCKNETKYKQWATSWSKVKDVFTDILLMSKALKETTLQRNQNDIPISFIGTSSDVSKKNLDQLEPSFMYTHILKEIFLTIKFEEVHIKKFMQHCRDAFADNTEQLNIIKKVEHTYHDKTPIWWYSCQCFLFPMLNSALRHMDIDVIIKIGFFMKDLHRHIEELQKKQFGDDKSHTTFIVYRGQGLSKQDFEKMRQIKGGLIAFNNFLSTSKDPEVSRAFGESNKDNCDLVGIFFVITVDPAKSTTPLASIKDVSYFPDEDEVLFAMNSIFRIGDITSMDENLFQVDLTLTNDDDKDLRILTDCIEKGTYPEAEGWYRLGMVLMRLGQPEQARQVYEDLFEQATNEGDKAYFYNNLGWTKFNQGEHEDAIKLYEKSLEIYKRTHSPTDPDVAWPYNNIGAVYNKMREYSKALSFYEAALAIRQQSLPPNHPDLAYTYHHIGSVYNKMQDYSKALSFYETALAMRQQSLPPNHPELAASYNHIGWAYKNMGDYSKTLLCYEKSLAIQQQSLPPNHPDLAKSYDNLDRMYRKMGDYSKALSLYEKSLVIKQQLSPPNYYNLAASYNNIGELYENMNQYPKALTFFERAVDIAQKILPSNHPKLLKWQKDLENITDKYDKITPTMHSDLVQDLIR